MKKLLAIVLLLCLVCTSAFAVGNLERTETRVVREAKDNGKYDVNVFIQVKNTGDAAVSLDKANIYLYDANSTVLDDDTTYSMYPPVLQPGEVGYIYNWMYNVDASLANAISSYSINISNETDPRYVDQVLHVGHSAEYAEVERFSSTYPILTYTITNDTPNTVVWDMNVVAIIRSTEGKILDIQSSSIYNVGLKEGSTMLYEMDLGYSNLESWKTAGHTVGSIETYVYADVD